MGSLGSAGAYYKNKGVGTPVTPEKIALFLGEVSKGQGVLTAVEKNSDLETLFGDANFTKNIAGDATDRGDGKVGLPSVGHGIPAGTTITVAGTTNYNGDFVVQDSTTADIIHIVAAYVEELGIAGATATTKGLKLDLVKILEVAAKNGGSEWFAYVVGYKSGETVDDWEKAMDVAIAEDDRDFEYAVFCEQLPTTASEAKTLIEAVSDKMTALEEGFDWHFSIFTARGVDKDTETYAQYETYIKAYIEDVVAPRCIVIPAVFGNELACLAGRLASQDNIAAKPMKVLDGAVIDPGVAPTDSNDIKLTKASHSLLKNLQALRFSTFAFRKTKKGMYFGDINLLCNTGDDLPTVEILRPYDKALRKVFNLAENEIGNNQVQNTPTALGAFVKRLIKPIQKMSAGDVEERELVPPVTSADFSVTLERDGAELVAEISGEVQPVESPTKIKFNISRQVESESTEETTTESTE